MIKRFLALILFFACVPTVTEAARSTNRTRRSNPSGWRKRSRRPQVDKKTVLDTVKRRQVRNQQSPAVREPIAMDAGVPAVMPDVQEPFLRQGIMGEKTEKLSDEQAIINEVNRLMGLTGKPQGSNEIVSVWLYTPAIEIQGDAISSALNGMAVPAVGRGVDNQAKKLARDIANYNAITKDVAVHIRRGVNSEASDNKAIEMAEYQELKRFFEICQTIYKDIKSELPDSMEKIFNRVSFPSSSWVKADTLTKMPLSKDVQDVSKDLFEAVTKFEQGQGNSAERSMTKLLGLRAVLNLSMIAVACETYQDEKRAHRAGFIQRNRGRVTLATLAIAGLAAGAYAYSRLPEGAIKEQANEFYQSASEWGEWAWQGIKGAWSATGGKVWDWARGGSGDSRVVKTGEYEGLISGGYDVVKKALTSRQVQKLGGQSMREFQKSTGLTGGNLVRAYKDYVKEFAQ